MHTQREIKGYFIDLLLYGLQGLSQLKGGCPQAFHVVLASLIRASSNSFSSQQDFLSETVL